MAAWLLEQRIESVAMESTGVYWIPVYEVLEAHGLNVVLVNARHLHNVPGRKTDMLDCQWIQRLHASGLLRGSFRPMRRRGEQPLRQELWRLAGADLTSIDGISREAVSS
jgi:hypothetical protein